MPGRWLGCASWTSPQGADGLDLTVVKVSRLVMGTLRFKVKATSIGSGQPRATLTTQVSQTRRP